MSRRPASRLAAAALFAAYCTVCLAPCAYADSQFYQMLRIVSPRNNGTVHNNSGNVVVSIQVSPPLRADTGDRFAVLLDGKTATTGTATQFELNGIDRGAHTLEVQVIAQDGTILIVSPDVTFEMWQASRLFPNRRH